MKKVTVLVAILVLAGMVASAQASTILYSDSFSHSSTYFPGSAVETVASNAADYGATSTSWSASTGWKINTVSSRAYINGSKTYYNAWLAFTPQSGYIYTLTTSMTLEWYNSGEYLAIGFGYGSSYPPATGTIFSNLSKATLIQNNLGTSGSQEIGTAMRTASSWTSSYITYTTDTGVTNSYRTFTVVLDTTGTAWKASFYVDGTLYRSETYSSNPVINAVGFGAYTTYAMVDSFELSVDVPEPSTLALLAAGLVGLAAYAWRKRK